MRFRVNLILDCKDRELSGNVDKKKNPALTGFNSLSLHDEEKLKIEDFEYLYLSKFPPFLQHVISIKESFNEVTHV